VNKLVTSWVYCIFLLIGGDVEAFEISNSRLPVLTPYDYFDREEQDQYTVIVLASNNDTAPEDVNRPEATGTNMIEV